MMSAKQISEMWGEIFFNDCSIEAQILTNPIYPTMVDILTVAMGKLLKQQQAQHSGECDVDPETLKWTRDFSENELARVCWSCANKVKSRIERIV